MRAEPFSPLPTLPFPKALGGCQPHPLSIQVSCSWREHYLIFVCSLKYFVILHTLLYTKPYSTHAYTYMLTHILCTELCTQNHGCCINFFFKLLATLRNFSSPTRDWTCASAVEARSLNHWTTGEVPRVLHLISDFRNSQRLCDYVTSALCTDFRT